MKPRNLEEKQDEKARLAKAYRFAQRAKWRELCEQEPRLPIYRKALRKQADPVALLLNLSDSPLRFAPLPVRYAVLRLIDQHAWKMARRFGMAPLDDPLPPSTNVFLTAREMLAVR
jgi:hypothetical protein